MTVLPGAEQESHILAEEAAGAPGIAGRSPAQMAWTRLKKDPVAVACIAVVRRYPNPGVPSSRQNRRETRRIPRLTRIYAHIKSLISPPPIDQPLTFIEDRENYALFVGEVAVPVWQQGQRPYRTEGGGFAGDYFFVEGVHYDIKPLNATNPEVTVTLDVSPAGYFSSNPF